MDKKLAKTLSLDPNGAMTNLRIKGFGPNSFYNFKTWEVELVLIDCEGNPIKLSAYTVPNLSDDIQIIKFHPQLLKVENVEEIMRNTQWKQFKLLLGNSCSCRLLKGMKALGLGFIHIDTKLGPIITGRPPTENEKNTLSPIESSYRINVIKDIDSFWKLESVGISDDPEQNDDKKAWEHFQETVIKDDGRYVISWP